MSQTIDQRRFEKMADEMETYCKAKDVEGWESEDLRHWSWMVQRGFRAMSMNKNPSADFARWQEELMERKDEARAAAAGADNVTTAKKP